MTTVQRLIFLVGALVVIAGVIGLLVPVSVSGDRGSIDCGNAVVKDLSAAEEKDRTNIVENIPVVSEFVNQTKYVPECNSAVSTRRSWTIPVTVIGVLVVAGSFLVRGRA